MAQFDSIISSLLKSVVQAQHDADIYADNLQNDSKKKGLTSSKVAISSVELNLNYAINDALAECEIIETDYKRLYSFIKDLALQVSKFIIPIVVSELKPSAIGGENKSLGLWVALHNGTGAEYRKLLTYTNRKIYSELVTLGETILNEQGSVQAEPLVSAIHAVVASDLLLQPDIEQMFTEDGHAVRERVEKKILETLNPFVEQLVANANFKSKRVSTAADVIVDAKGLEKIPVECMHSIRLKVDMLRNLNTEPKKQ